MVQQLACRTFNLKVGGSSLVLKTCFFLRQEILLHVVSLHPGV